MSEKVINCAILYDQAVINHLKGKPALKIEVSGRIKRITEEEFELHQADGTVFSCVVLNRVQNPFRKEIVYNSVKKVRGYISGGKMYVTNCFDVQKSRRRYKKLYLKK